MTDPLWQGVVYSECASKANSRKLVTVKGRPMFIKSDKARKFEGIALQQITPPAEQIEQDVVLTAVIYYASRRPDLDESLFMDILQKAGVIKNDRQIKEKHIHWGLDKESPRVWARLTPLEDKKKPDAEAPG